MVFVLAARDLFISQRRGGLLSGKRKVLGALYLIVIYPRKVGSSLLLREIAGKGDNKLDEVIFGLNLVFRNRNKELLLNLMFFSDKNNETYLFVKH